MFVDDTEVHIPQSYADAITRINSGVTRVGITWGGNWQCHPYFPEKSDDLFSHHRLSVLPCRPYFSPHKTDDLFLLITVTWNHFSWSHLGVTPPPESVTPDLFFTSPTSFFHFSLQIQPQFFSFGCHPMEGVTRGGPPLPPPVTPMRTNPVR